MIRILFVCVRNSARSQMAEGLMNALGGCQLEAYSAGTDPGTVSEFAIMVLREIGVDISRNVSKSLDDVAGIEFDYIVTLCSEAEEACPYVPGRAVRLHWPLADPAVTTGVSVQTLNAFRTTRNTLIDLIKIFIKSNGKPGVK